MAISGSFVRGDWAGPASGPFLAILDNNTKSGSVYNMTAIRDTGTIISATPTASFAFRERGIGEQKVVGYLQGTSFGEGSTMDGAGSFGRHLQVGLSKETTDGSPTAPSLKLDYPGSMWRFRWVVKTGNRSLTIAAKQNSTGSLYRPSVIIRKNPSIGLNADISASAPNGAGWVTIGPINFTVSGSDVVWVEMHNNNNSWSMQSWDGMLQPAPCWFDHIVAS